MPTFMLLIDIACHTLIIFLLYYFAVSFTLPPPRRHFRFITLDIFLRFSRQIRRFASLFALITPLFRYIDAADLR